MTVIEAMRQTTDGTGNIVIPVGATRGGTDIPGVITETELRVLFGAQLDSPLPITQAQFDALVATVPGQWGDNWQWYRENVVIVVQG
jgi:hypothetical protein